MPISHCIWWQANLSVSCALRYSEIGRITRQQRITGGKDTPMPVNAKHLCSSVESPLVLVLVSVEKQLKVEVSNPFVEGSAAVVVALHCQDAGTPDPLSHLQNNFVREITAGHQHVTLLLGDGIQNPLVVGYDQDRHRQFSSPKVEPSVDLRLPCVNWDSGYNHAKWGRNLFPLIFLYFSSQERVVNRLGRAIES